MERRFACSGGPATIDVTEGHGFLRAMTVVGFAQKEKSKELSGEVRYMSLLKCNMDGQFLLSKKALFFQDNWNMRESNGWILATHPDLPVIDVQTPEGSHLGWIIGFPINLSSCIVTEKLVIHANINDEDKVKNVEGQLYELGGRYVAIILGCGISRLYLDPGGSLSVVYSLDEQVIASTPALIKLDDGFDKNLIKSLKMPNSGKYYPFGLTPRKNIRRLLPNHFFDLESWKSIRHWPVKNTLSVVNNFSENIKTIIKIIKNNLQAVANNYFIHMSLTAGRDSRMLLACVREISDKVLFFTFAEKKQTADIHIANILSSQLNLNHKVLQIECANDTEQKDWLYRVGHCVSGQILNIHPTLRHLDRKYALLPAMAGEVARAYYWSDDEDIGCLDPLDILERLHFPAFPPLLEVTERWFSEISDFPSSVIMDLAYIEQRLGCWAGPQMYGNDNRSVCHLWPLSHRMIFESMLRFPSAYKQKQQLVEDICVLEWPELLNLPFNEFSGALKYIMRSREYIRSIKKGAYRQLRRVLY